MVALFAVSSTGMFVMVLLYAFKDLKGADFWGMFMVFCILLIISFTVSIKKEILSALREENKENERVLDDMCQRLIDDKRQRLIDDKRRDERHS